LPGIFRFPLALGSEIRPYCDRLIQYSPSVIECPLLRRYSIRWQSKGFQWGQHFRKWAAVLACLDTLEAAGLCAKSVKKVKRFLSDPERHSLLLTEMATSFDITPCFIQVITFFETDAMVAPFVTAKLNELETRLSTFESCPESHINLHTIAERIARNEFAPETAEFTQRRNALVEHGLACVRPATKYYMKHYVGPGATHRSMVDAYRAFQLFDPSRIGDLQQHVASWLDALPFIDQEKKARLIRELPAYVAIAVGVREGPRTLIRWWGTVQDAVPEWSASAADVATFTGGSACMERVFALAGAMFNEQQMRALEDQIGTSLQLAYNERPDNKSKKKFDLGLDQAPGYYASIVALPAVPIVVVGAVPIVVVGAVPIVVLGAGRGREVSEYARGGGRVRLRIYRGLGTRGVKGGQGG
jgi:hypothetical protein